ncbi:YgfZ/GcvT domain-containing protein [Blastopirellula marina]|uniref:Uncharacterized protein n=1 Tax=Blastopirellula marina TaxID=124 RepID=A0A2S8GRK7_9BACT|nr:hypothetical protein [Blastopirellula marina]PQO47063.1 hypothetical protein C5Y93_06105 [Blastopirellula marina]
MSDHSVKLSWIRSPWTCWITISGPSHLRFIQGLCSNDVVSLAVGRGVEAYVPTVQGKVLGHGFFWKSDDRLEFAGLGDQADALLSHLQKYAMIEDVEVTEQSESDDTLFLWGDAVEAFIRETFGDTDVASGEHVEASYEGEPVHLFRFSNLSVDAVAIRGPGVSSLVAKLPEREVTEANSEAWDAVRVAGRFPLHGVDITAEHLAQEVNRDDQAISFTKGCYLGQETVARIDAMGHVNKKLVTVKVDRPVESLPQPIEVDGKQIGQITSLVEVDGQQVGLAMIRRSHNAAGTSIASAWGTVDVL